MPTFKAMVFSHHLKEDGTYNVKIRVTHQNKRKYIATEEYVTKQDITKKLVIKNQDIEDSLNRTIKNYRDRCRSLGERLMTMDVDRLVAELTKVDTEKFDLDFVEFGRGKADELEKKGRGGSAKNYRATINSIVRYSGREKISIAEITANFLEKYSTWLLTSESPTKRKIGSRAVSLYTGYLRSLHNMAKREYNDEDTGVIRIPWSPFSKFIPPKQPPARQRALTKEQIISIFRFQDEKKRKRVELARDVSMLSFFLIGMNTADLYDCNEYKNGRITYKRAKTKGRRKDEALISIKVEPEALNLLTMYKGSKRVFRFCEMYTTKGTFNEAINKGLKKIGKALEIEDLEFYAFRHTWATLAVNDVGIDKYTVHTALNHVDDSMKVTDIYIKKDWRIIDEANRKMIDYIKK